MIVRKDLSHQQRAVQACHAIAALTAEAVRRRDKHFEKWVREDRTLVLLRVENREELLRQHDRVEAAGLIHHMVVEPDWNSGPTETALAIYPGEPSRMKELFGDLPLL